MKATIIIAAAVALVLVAWLFRYSIEPISEGTYNMLDRWTGQVWKCVHVNTPLETQTKCERI